MSHHEPTEWQRIAELFEGAAELPVDRRDAWLDSVAAHEPRLIETVRRMLAADTSDGNLLGEGIAAAAHLVLEPEPTLVPGTRVGAFDVIGVLGRGGMGTVYAAKDRHLDRPVALKFLQVRPGSGRDDANRLIAEAKAASALDHPNVAAIYQVGESQDGRYFIAMPRFDGETLRARMDARTLSVAEAVAVARDVAAGLAAAHRAGIIHRDVTPANIFLTNDGGVKLLDFGIAALATEGPSGASAAGTLPYMSPEQVRGEATDARTDVWSLGVVLYRMLTGTLPFAEATPAETLAAIRGNVLAPRLTGRRGVPARLGRVVDTALRKARMARYADAGEMLEALDAAQAPPSWTRQHLVVTGAGALLVALIMMAAVTEDRAAVKGPSGRSGPWTLAVLSPGMQAGDTTGVYLANGMADELTARLAKLRRLRVKGPRAARGIDSTLAPQALGRALNVDYLLESRISGGDSAPVVSLRLIDAREGFRIWSNDYRVPVSGLLAVQDSIARDVAAAVAGELSSGERAVLGAQATTSPQAYDRFLRGNYLIAKRTPAAALEAMAEYDAAVALDPRFAEALGQGSYARAIFVDWGWTHPRRSRQELIDDAIALAGRAVALDPASALAWLARAYILVVRDPARHAGALEAFERSLAIDSLNPEAHHQYGQTLMNLGRFPEADAAYRRAIALDPARPITLVPLAAVAMQHGDMTAALRWIDSAVSVTRLIPAPYALAVRAHISLAAGDVETALRDARRALDLDASYPAPALSVLMAAEARRGDTTAAVATLEQLLGSIDVEHPTPTDVRFVASALFMLGRGAEALTLIERASPRGAQLWFYLQSRDFDPYRSLPRFRAVERSVDPRG